MRLTNFSLFTIPNVSEVENLPPLKLTNFSLFTQGVSVAEVKSGGVILGVNGCLMVKDGKLVYG